ncbi:MAG: hypothetical protein WDM81_17855 [Rhizomicrobium sp.]
MIAVSNAEASNGFRKILDSLWRRRASGPRPHRAPYEDDGQGRARILRQPAQLKAVDHRHSDVGDQAIDLGQDAVVEQGLGGGKQANRMSRRLQEILHRLEDPRVIVDNGDGGFMSSRHFDDVPARREWVTGI